MPSSSCWSDIFRDIPDLSAPLAIKDRQSRRYKALRNKSRRAEQNRQTCWSPAKARGGDWERGGQPALMYQPSGVVVMDLHNSQSPTFHSCQAAEDAHIPPPPHPPHGRGRLSSSVRLPLLKPSALPFFRGNKWLLRTCLSSAADGSFLARLLCSSKKCLI